MHGANCQLTVVGITRHVRGYFLPSDFRSAEIGEDESYTVHIDPGEIATGDILGFSKISERDPRKVHLGIARKNPQGNVDVLHNSRIVGRLTLWPLVEFQRHEAYEVLRFIKRPIREVPELVLPHLPNFGLR